MPTQTSLEDLKYSLRSFQIHRLERTYEDLRSIDQYEKAYEFFFQQLYLPKGLSTPTVSTGIVLPASVESFLDKRIVSTLRKAAKLQQIINNADNQLAGELFSSEIRSENLDLPTYQHFYKKLDNYEDRIDQIMLMAEVVGDLYFISRMRLLRFTLEVGRKLVGRHPLLQLAEEALESYQNIENIDFLTNTIETREIDFHNDLWNNNLPEKYCCL